MNSILLRIANYIRKKISPTDAEIVLAMVVNTTLLELDKTESVQFAPIGGSCGPITLTGSTLPVFSYTIFDKSIMEFIRVRVELARPERIFYLAKIQPTDPEKEGGITPMQDAYKLPFERLSFHLWCYFPMYRRSPSTPILKAV